MKDYDPQSLETKWQRRWEDSGSHRASVDNDKESFYTIFAYPGISGYLHLGHMRCYTYTDFIARYKKLMGYSVLFPAGSHPTGNQVISFANRVREKDQTVLEYLEANGATEDDIASLDTPEGVIEFFKKTYIRQWKDFGLNIDFSYFTDTSREDYSRFIRWQFKKLHEKDLLTQKPYYAPVCKVCGPVAVDPSETDLSKGGTAEVQEFTMLKFKYGDRYITAATLRPETVFGQTNLWVDPEETYAVVSVGDDELIMSHPAAAKYAFQNHDVEVIGSVQGDELIGELVEAPMIHRKIPILPADFTDPDVGSGIVTSVPSDAPYDWIALKDLKEDIDTLDKYGIGDIVGGVEPVPIIDSRDRGTNPAESVINEMDIRSQKDTDKLEEATRSIYRAGFHEGTMLDNCGEYAGLPVQEAKERIRQELISTGEAQTFHALSEEVICRCGAHVVMGRIPDQWFIRYSDEDLTIRSKEHAKAMTVRPDSYSKGLPDTLEWFQDRSCARLGNWVGTRFPLDDRWIIEAIADSTLYPAYYVVAKYYNLGTFKADQMTEKFFDFIFLGKGELDDVSASTDIPEEALEEIREEFLYWYPLDLNLGGKEHMTVHFPVFLMNHVALLNEEHWPKGIMVNWYLTMTGGKISKSKGGADPIPDVAERFGIDTLRLYYAHSSSPFADKEWNENEVFNYRKRLVYLWRMIHRMKDVSGAKGPVDEHLESRFNRLIKEVIEHMDEYSIRKAANVVFYDIPSEIEWYFKRGGDNGRTVRELAIGWLKLISPFTPHIADELGEIFGIKCISDTTIPKADESAISPYAEFVESYLKDVIADIKSILEIARVSGDTIHVYVAPSWKREVLDRVLAEPEKGMSLMSELVDMHDVSAKTLTGYLRYLLDEVKKNISGLEMLSRLDESSVLEENKAFLQDEFGASVKVYLDSDSAYDPEGRRKKAVPGKPAIYIE